MSAMRDSENERRLMSIICSLFGHKPTIYSNKDAAVNTLVISFFEPMVPKKISYVYDVCARCKQLVFAGHDLRTKEIKLQPESEWKATVV